VGSVDAVWLDMDRPNNLMVIASVVFLESTPDWDEVRRLVQDRVVARYPVFRQRPVAPGTPFGRPSWVDDSGFDLARHLKRATLPPPGDDPALQRYIEDQLSRPIDRAHPLWEFHLVDGYGSGAALVCRTHHSLADGLALLRVLMSLTEDAEGSTGDGDVVDLAVPTVKRHRWPVSLAASGLSPGVDLVRLGWRGTQVWRAPGDAAALAGLAWRTAQVAGTLLFTSNPPNPLDGEPGARKLVVWSDRLPLDVLRDLRHLSGTTLNDVLMSAVAAALHSYQVEHGVDPVDLTTMVPVNVRPLDEALPPELGNEFALIFLRLPSGLAAPLARLAETKRRMDWIKASPEPALTYGILNVLGRMNRTVARHLIDFFADKAIGVTTNARGPDSLRYLAHTAVTGVLGWVPGSGRHTLGICIVTYAGSAQVGFMTDASVIPDPGSLLIAFEGELRQLGRLGRSGPAGGGHPTT
jgi:WS/DGAT/MGAT family acyltransferase